MRMLSSVSASKFSSQASCFQRDSYVGVILTYPQTSRNRAPFGLKEVLKSALLVERQCSHRNVHLPIPAVVTGKQASVTTAGSYNP